MNLNAFIEAAVAAYIRAYVVTADLRPIDRKLAIAEFSGFCKAADALGLAMTPTHFHIACVEANRSVPDRPVWRAIDNSHLREWDANMATLVLNKITD
jgi:hypothetical protein